MILSSSGCISQNVENHEERMTYFKTYHTKGEKDLLKQKTKFILETDVSLRVGSHGPFIGSNYFSRIVSPHRNVDWHH